MQDKIELDEKDFSFVCPMKTKDMTKIEEGYFCGECNKKVYDVSDMSKSEYTSLVHKTENICVTFKKVATLSLALSFAACSSPEKTEHRLKGKVVSKSACNTQVKSNDTNRSVPFVASGFDEGSEVGGEPVPIEPLIKEQ